MKSKYKNPYYYPSTNFTPPNLEKYIAATKTDIMKLIEKPSHLPSNLSPSERETLNSLQNRPDIIINKADKGVKVVVMDRHVYINNCEYQLNNKEFYVKLDHDPTQNICNDINSEIKNMLDNKLKTRKNPSY